MKQYSGNKTKVNGTVNRYQIEVDAAGGIPGKDTQMCFDVNGTSGGEYGASIGLTFVQEKKA